MCMSEDEAGDTVNELKKRNENSACMGSRLMLLN